MDTGQMIAERIEQLIEARGTNARAVALAAGMSPTGVRDIIIRKTKNPTYANLLKIAEVLGVDFQEIATGEAPDNIAEPPSIAVPGKVGAGAPVDLFDGFEKGDGLYHVACPSNLSPHGVVAVEVEGDSMEPVYSEGDVLFFTRATHEGVPTEAINKKVIAETEDGMVWVKLLRPGSEPGLFHLLSINPTGTNMHDVRIKWASPVRLHLPADLVTVTDRKR